MELNRKTREILGATLFVSSVTLCATTAALCTNKRAGAAMLATLAALECAAGAMLVCGTDEQIREKVQKRRDAALAAAKAKEEEAEIVTDVEGYEELFSEEDCVRVEADMRDELENGNAEKAAPEVREVPLDEDATEEEFQ